MPLLYDAFDIRRIFIGSDRARRAYLGSLPVWSEADFILNAELGAFQLIGFDMLPPFNGQLGVFELEGSQTRFYRSLLLDAVQGQFVLNGQDGEFNKFVEFESGFYTLAGTEFFRGNSVGFNSGAFAFAGEDAEFSPNLPFTESGEFSLTGFEITFGVGQAPIEMETGVIVYRGEDAVFIASRYLEAQIGTFTLEGEEVIFERQIEFESGEYSLTGEEIDIDTGIIFECESGAFSLIGEDATLEKVVTDPHWNDVIVLFDFAGEDEDWRVNKANPGTYDISDSSIGDEFIPREDLGSFGFGAGLVDTSPSSERATLLSSDDEVGAFEGEFTIETRVKTTPSENLVGLVNKWLTTHVSGDGRTFAFIIDAGNNDLRFLASLDGESIDISVGGPLSGDLDEYNHAAVDRDSSGVIRVYWNGDMVASGTLAGTLKGDGSGTQLINLGNYNNAYGNQDVLLNQVRITDGTARYASDAGFTPPTEPYPMQGPS